ncbi:MAG: hypothetical protein GQ536_07350 [Candidatus Aminicenantes bacterium]|nr:hypothetical protein [Candidatus Aminicenantes bacterium]
MEFEFLIDNKAHRVTLEKKENIFIVSDGENRIEADIRYISPNTLSLLIKGRSYKVYFARDKEKRYFSLGGEQFVVQESAEGAEDVREDGGEPQEDEFLVRAPMPGKVIKINVSEKEDIRKNQTLAIVEAMKMEN